MTGFASKSIAATSGNLSSIPRYHKVEREKWSPQVILELPHAYRNTCLARVHIPHTEKGGEKREREWKSKSFSKQKFLKWILIIPYSSKIRNTFKVPICEFFTMPIQSGFCYGDPFLLADNLDYKLAFCVVPLLSESSWETVGHCASSGICCHLFCQGETCALCVSKHFLSYDKLQREFRRCQ